MPLHEMALLPLVVINAARMEIQEHPMVGSFLLTASTRDLQHLKTCMNSSMGHHGSTALSPLFHSSSKAV